MAQVPVEDVREQLKALSNEELREQLVKHGLSVGPVMGTTRKVYEKKLLNLLSPSNGPETPARANGSPAPTTPQASSQGNGRETSPLVRRSVTPLAQPHESTPILPKKITEEVDDDEDYCGEESFRIIPELSHPVEHSFKDSRSVGNVFGIFAVLLAIIAVITVFLFEKESKEFVAPYVKLGKEWAQKASEKASSYVASYRN
uniref:LEM domain-containing protein n=1 Tax=Steinernema glaseri TaxID=37863 RepID=A0A1I8AG22_9BILA